MSSERERIQNRRLRLSEELRALSFEPLMRGSLGERVRRCGRSNCACARDESARHRGKYLTVSLKSRTEAVHVRPEDEPHLQKALAAYEKLWAIVNELTSCELADLRRQARERQRARKRRA